VSGGGGEESIQVPGHHSQWPSFSISFLFDNLKGTENKINVLESDLRPFCKAPTLLLTECIDIKNTIQKSIPSHRRYNTERKEKAKMKIFLSKNVDARTYTGNKM
jgi:hypothetical protein